MEKPTAGTLMRRFNSIRKLRNESTLELRKDIVVQIRFPAQEKASRKAISLVVQELRSLLDEWGYEFLLTEVPQE